VGAAARQPAVAPKLEIHRMFAWKYLPSDKELVRSVNPVQGHGGGRWCFGVLSGSGSFRRESRVPGCWWGIPSFGVCPAATSNAGQAWAPQG
jgi:hypothetical protein